MILHTGPQVLINIIDNVAEDLHLWTISLSEIPVHSIDPILYRENTPYVYEVQVN